MKLGERIRELRKAKGLTQKQLGKLIDISEVMVGQYERGIRKPKYDKLKEIAVALGVHPNTLIENDTESFEYKVCDDFEKIGIFTDQLRYLGYVFVTKPNCYVDKDNAIEIIDENKMVIGCKSNGKEYLCKDCNLNERFLLDAFNTKLYRISIDDYVKLKDDSFSYVDYKVKELIKDKESVTELNIAAKEED